jgi:hypothetical protein
MRPLCEGADIPPLLFPERISERQIPDDQSDVFYVDSSAEKPLNKTDGMITIENFRESQKYVALSVGTRRGIELASQCSHFASK